jgi:hypothetical protein
MPRSSVRVKSGSEGCSIVRVKYLDPDSVYLKSLMDRAIGEVGACTRHADCDIFDCRGECDLVRGKCRSAVVNNNLQVMYFEYWSN